MVLGLRIQGFRFRLGSPLGLVLVWMAWVRVRCWVIHYGDANAHRDRNTRMCMCVCAAKAEAAHISAACQPHFKGSPVSFRRRVFADACTVEAASCQFLPTEFV